MLDFLSFLHLKRFRSLQIILPLFHISVPNYFLKGFGASRCEKQYHIRMTRVCADKKLCEVNKRKEEISKHRRQNNGGV